MHGNVNEWCQDWYDAKYDEELVTETSVDPLGPAKGLERVYRSGSWHHWAHMAWSARRDGGALHHGQAVIGFRVVSVLEDQVPGANVEPTTDRAKP